MFAARRLAASRPSALACALLLTLCAMAAGCSALATFQSGEATAGGDIGVVDTPGDVPDADGGGGDADAGDTTPPVSHPSGFGGIAFAHVTDETRQLRVYWHPARMQATYEVWAATSRADPGKQLSIIGTPGPDRADVDKQPAGVHYLRVIARFADGTSADLGTDHSFELDLQPGTVHTVAAIGRAHRAPPDAVGVVAPSAVATDRWDNLLFSATAGSIAVWCANNNAPYCTDRAGLIQTISGRDGLGDDIARDTNGPPRPADLVAHGVVTGLAVNRDGDIYFADGTNKRITLICYSGRGRCAGVRFGYLMQLADLATEGQPVDLTIDRQQNVLYINSRAQVRVICRNKQAPYCAGASSADDRVTIAGVLDNNADGGSNTPPTATPIGLPRGIAVDDAYNVYFGDFKYKRVRAVCVDVTFGVCTGKRTGVVVLVGADGAIGTTQVTGVVDIAIDRDGHIIVAHLRRLSRICASSLGSCVGSKLGEQAFVGNASVGNLRGVAVDRRGSYYAAHDNIYVICNHAASLGCSSGTAAYDAFVAPPAGVSGGIDLLSAHVDVSAVTVDKAGNAFFVDHRRRVVSTLCLHDKGLCVGRALSRVHDIAGNGTNASVPAWPVDGVNPLKATLWQQNVGVSDLTINANDQLYLAIQSANVLATLCSGQSDVCPTASVGKLAVVAGNFQRGNPGSGAKRLSAPLEPTVVTIDKDQTVVVGTPKQVVAVCLKNSGACSGAIPGTLRILAGNGTSGDSVDGALAALSPLRPVSTIVADSDGNLLFGTRDEPRLHLLCNTNSGRCGQREQGRLYQLAGSGAITHTEGPSPQPAATASLGAILGVALRPKDANVFISSNRRLRIYCVDDLNGPCQTAGASTVQTLGGNGLSEPAGSGLPLDPQRSLAHMTKLWQRDDALYVAGGHGLKLVLGN